MRKKKTRKLKKKTMEEEKPQNTGHGVAEPTEHCGHDVAKPTEWPRCGKAHRKATVWRSLQNETPVRSVQEMRRVGLKAGGEGRRKEGRWVAGLKDHKG